MLLGAHPAQAERQHTVRAGQNLATIARGYDVSITSLAAANERPPTAPLRVGEVLSVPAKGVAYLGAGESLWTLARRHGCSVDALARANGLDPTASLKPGTRLVLPGAAAPSSARPTRRDANLVPGPARGVARLYRIATEERLTLTLTDPRGRVRPQASARLARFLRPRHASKQKRPEPRLVALLAEIAQHYRGRTIQIVSGYRLPGGYTSRESRHTRGAAIDFRVEGVPTRALRDYLRHFEKVGIGFYPYSNFVHLDVRDKNAYWIDLSSPGTRPAYLDREQREHFDGKNKDEGLVELGRSVAEALDRGDHEEPTESDPRAGDE